MPSGFTVSHIEPDEVRRSPADVRLMYHSWALDLVIAAKDREIAEGIQADGTPMRPIAAATRKHRRSAMTASGKGDPSAPPLTPGRKLSRTRSLLAGNAYPDRVEVYWLYDAFTGDTWSRVLTYQADHGRDVFGLAPKDLERIRLQLLGKWIRWTRSGRVVPDEVRGRQVVTAQMAASRGGVARPVHVTPPGSTDLTHATMGIGTSASTEAAIRSGGWSGGMTEAQLRAFATGGAAANVQSGPGAAYNRLLSHVWGGPAGGSSPVQPLRPKPAPPKAPSRPVATPKAAAGGFTMEVSGAPPAASVDAVRKAVASIPAPVHRVLAAKGVTWAYADRMADRYPDLAGERPRGWPEGMTWAHADGVYRDASREVFVARTRTNLAGRTVESRRTPAVIFHETGHALDHALDDASTSERWRSAHAADLSRMDDATRQQNAYFLQPGEAGRKEAWAELFANAHGHATIGHRAADAFPACLALLREILGALQ